MKNVILIAALFISTIFVAKASQTGDDKIANVNTNETTMQLENWMFDVNFLHYSVSVSENNITLEDWMLNDRIGKTIEPKIEMENWMFKSVLIDGDEKLQLENWMFSSAK